MRASPLRAVSVVPLLLVGGCGWPFHCESERIEVTLAGTVERGEERTALDASDAVAPGNLGEEYAIIKPILVGDMYRSPTAVIWTLIGTASGALYFASDGPREVGIVQTVEHQGAGGWGVASLPPGVQAGVLMQSGEFSSIRASGSLEVLGVEPLQLAVDVEVADDEDVRRVRGDMGFTLVTEDVACE